MTRRIVSLALPLTLALSLLHHVPLGAEPFPAPYPAPEPGARLTPPIADAPSINGAKVYGARPGAPLLYQVAVSGTRPLEIRAEGLPEGLEMNSDGLIRGSVARRGDYEVAIIARNAHGEARETLRFSIGDAICLTPPMGWNSWYSYSEAVSQEGIEKIGRLMVATGLARHGWSYVNIDDCWQGTRQGTDGALQPNSKFPDMKALCDALHAMGLKAGIYHTPWIGTYAGFRGGSSPTAEEGGYDSLAAPQDQQLQEGQIFGRYPGVHRQKADRVGATWHLVRDAKQWAAWGFDYVKMDWNPNDVATTRRIREALDASGRDIVLSLSNDAPLEHAAGLARYANLWRTTGDIQDNWGSVSRIGFSQEPWQAHSGPGHWNDPDILQVGLIGRPNQPNVRFRPTGLTPCEAYSHVTLWCLLSAPLLISSDLEHIDDFTLGLLTNDEVIAIDQDPAGKPARKAWAQGDFQVWTKELSDGTLAAGFFNLGDRKGVCEAPLSALGLQGPQAMRDLWRRRDVGTAEGSLRIELNPHGAALFRMTPASER